MVLRAAAAVGDESKFSKLEVLVAVVVTSCSSCSCIVGPSRGTIFLVGESNWYVSSTPPALFVDAVGIGDRAGKKLDSTSPRWRLTSSSVRESSGPRVKSTVTGSK
jgi:hypothetical protein